MRAITLWQPWASLIVCGAKQIETRSWPTKIRGRVAIHAAKKSFDTDPYFDRELWTFVEPLGLPDIYSFDKLPLGCVVGTVEIVDCVEVKCLISHNDKNDPVGIQAKLSNGDRVQYPQIRFGDYAPGRYAWLLDKPVMFNQPIPAKGRQGFWNWEETVI